MDKKELISKLNSLGIKVTEGKVRKSDLERVIHEIKAAQASEAKAQSSKNGYYEFSFRITEDYSKVFLDDTKDMSEDDAYEYYDGQEYMGSANLNDVAWQAVRRLFSDVTSESMEVEVSVLNQPTIPDNEWTKERAAETLKNLTLDLRASFYYELSIESRTKLENAAIESIKKSVEA